MIGLGSGLGLGLGVGDDTPREREEGPRHVLGRQHAVGRRRPHILPQVERAWPPLDQREGGADLVVRLARTEADGLVQPVAGASGRGRDG